MCETVEAGRERGRLQTDEEKKGGDKPWMAHSAWRGEGSRPKRTQKPKEGKHEMHRSFFFFPSFAGSR